MRYSILTFLISCHLMAIGQKPPLDTSTFRKWSFIDGGSISNDGNYVSYHIYNQPAGTNRLIIQSKHGDWKKEFSGIYMSEFTNDSRLAVFKTGKDSLCLLTLGKEEFFYIPHVSEFSLCKNDQSNWLAYRSTTEAGVLILRNLINGEERRFSSVTHYLSSGHGRWFWLGVQIKKDSSLESHLQTTDLSTGQVKNVWSSSGSNQKTGGFVVSSGGDQLAFIVENAKSNLTSNELWYYKDGMDTAVKLVDNRTSGIESGLQLANLQPDFSEDGSEIFFRLRDVAKRKPNPNAVQVDVWSYTDKVLQPFQLLEAKQESQYLAVMNLLNKKIIQLEHPAEIVVAHSNDFALVKHELGYYASFESYWNLAAQASYWLVSTKDGSRKLLKDHIVNPDEGIGLSPGGKWILYFNSKQNCYFSYEISTGITRNITKGIQSDWLDKENDRPDFKLTWVPWRDTWLQDDKAVLIYDNYDIWMVDPGNVKPALNLTNGYGRLHHIKFRLATEGPQLRDISLEKKAVFVLTAFDEINKNRGFYHKTLSKQGDPELRFMGPYVFGDWEGWGAYNFPPVKAQKSNTWLVKRMSATEAPNYFVSDDLIHYTALVNVQPQKEYNWMTTELIHWKTFDGSTSSGILYKPENFDPRKKYPVIFDFYERRSDELNLYIWPKAAQDRINIPWYVSHEYLVFTPDIHYKRGQPGQSAYNAVVSAALYLSKKPWVDAKKMGIQGHSFGGYEVNYIVTQTNLFAAACSASGVSNLISWYGAVPRTGHPKYSVERQQDRMEGTLWQMPHQYIMNSPIFQADKVTTPLLMMNNKEDGAVPFAQGVEFFTGLRRLGKRVWMLQYDGDGHSVGRGKDAVDYSTRMAQFFDHYLKGAPAPTWMTRGIPARLKGIENGLELDKAIPTPGPGLDVRRPEKN